MSPAPPLLVLLRLLQGIGLGGEWGGAVLMVVENAPTNHRGLLGSMVQIGNPIGGLAAIAIFSLVSKLPDQELMSWGWRIPFLISIFLVGIGLFVRLSLVETPVFRQLKLNDDVAAIPVVEILTKHRRPFLTAIGLKTLPLIPDLRKTLSSSAAAEASRLRTRTAFFVKLRETLEALRQASRHKSASRKSSAMIARSIRSAFRPA